MNKIMELLKDIEQKAQELQKMIDTPANQLQYPNAFISQEENEIAEQGYQPDKN